MKSILLYVHDDAGMESRLQTALDVARATGGHIECVTAKPLTALMLSDPFGATFMVPEAIDAVNATAKQTGEHIAARMTKEDVPWSLTEGDGDPAEILVDRARLSDLLVLSLGDRQDVGEAGAHVLLGDVALSASGPVLAVPHAGLPIRLDGTAAVAWNGSREAANALRAAIPLLRSAHRVHLITISEKEHDFPATEAASYLSRHGIAAEIHEEPRGAAPVVDSLVAVLDRIGVDWLVMGAYGHGRLREWLFGGVTRDLLARSRIPLLIAH